MGVLFSAEMQGERLGVGAEGTWDGPGLEGAGHSALRDSSPHLEID